MKRKRFVLVGLVVLFLVVVAGLVQANGRVPPGAESKATLHLPEETREPLENNPTKSAMLEGAPLHVGGFAAGVLDHAKGFGLGLLVGGAVALGLVVVAGLVVAGPVLGVIALGAIAAGALYGLITGAAKFNVMDAVVQSLIGGVSAGVGWGLGAAGLLAGRALIVGRAAVNVITGGLASMASYLIQAPEPSLQGAGVAFGWGAATAGAFLGLGALAAKFKGAAGSLLGRLRSGTGGPPGATSTLAREAAVTAESELGYTGASAAESNPAALRRAGTHDHGSSATVDLKARADEIHATLPEFTQSKNTTAVGQVRNADGTAEILVGSNEVRLRRAQRAALLPGETPVDGPGHAEVTIIEAAKRNGQTVERIAASRPICPECATAIEEAGAIAASPLKGPGRK